MDAYGKSVETACSAICLAVLFHWVMNRDVLSWSSIKAVVIESRLWLKGSIATMSFTISFFPTFSSIQTCNDVSWNFVVVFQVDVHQYFFFGQNILYQGRYFSNAIYLLILVGKEISKRLNSAWCISPVSDAPRLFPKQCMYKENLH